MISRQLTSLRAFRPVRGLSLVEVLAALVIMGGAVTSLLLVQARSVELVQDARLSLDAERLARELIAEWRLQKVELDTQDEGALENGWRWERTQRRADISEHNVALEITLRMEHVTDMYRGERWIREFVWLIRHEDS
ncbi:MAG: hypothetical protein J5J06_12815 [Phycisphaerae bacterium]|nr:hypothetical protein [Phycisphaerae bacterium]